VIHVANATSAIVIAGGNDVAVPGAVETLTVTTVNNWPALPTGDTLKIIDAADEGLFGGYEIMDLTVVANGTNVTWQIIRGTENTAPHSHAAGWVAIPVLSLGGLDGRYQQLFNTTGVKTANYTALPSDFIPANVSAGGFTITLPTTPADKTRVAAKIIAIAGANTLNIVTGGSDVFNVVGGPTTATLTLLNQGVVLQYAAAGGIWYSQSTDTPLSQLDARYLASFGISVPQGAVTLLSQLNGAIIRNTSTLPATAIAGEETVLTGTTAGTTLTLPASTAQNSSINSIVNLSSQQVLIAAGAGTTINEFGITGTIGLNPNCSVQLVLVGSVWYAIGQFAPIPTKTWNVSHTWTLQGPIVNSATTPVPARFAPALAAGQTMKLVEANYYMLSGSCTVEIDQAPFSATPIWAPVSGLGALAVTTTPTDTPATVPPTVNGRDLFRIVITGAASTPAGLTVSLVFAVTA
jgi:hypothetical protein